MQLIRISCLEHKTNDWVRRKINFLVGPQEPLLATVKRRKLAWFGHVTRHVSLSKTILQGTLEGGRRRGRHRQCWMDNIKESKSLPMPGLLIRVFRRRDWKRTPAESSLVSRRSYRSRDTTERSCFSLAMDPCPIAFYLALYPTASNPLIMG